jgi:hypothetical protein
MHPTPETIPLPSNENHPNYRFIDARIGTATEFVGRRGGGERREPKIQNVRELFLTPFPVLDINLKWQNHFPRINNCLIVVDS